jgi:phosphoserine phosphatase RsbU/P
VGKECCGDARLKRAGIQTGFPHGRNRRLIEFVPRECCGYRIRGSLNRTDGLDCVKLNSPALTRFLRQQSLYIALATIVAAVFWSIGQQVNPLTLLVYSLCIGNLIAPSLDRLRFLYSERPFPYDWLVFLAILLVLTTPVFLISSVFVWLLAPPTPQTLFHLITRGWKFPFLVTIVFGILSYLYGSTKERLERRNVELQHSVETSTAQLEQQDQELQRALEIQQSLLPAKIPQIAGYSIAGAWQPARVVGGDYFDVLRLDDHRMGICIADVAGKGMASALLMANVQAIVRAFAKDSDGPAQVCSRINRLLCDNMATGKFVTFVYGVLDNETRVWKYCNAGHLYPLVVSANSVRTLKEGGAVLGVFPDWQYLDSEVELKAGDRLLLFTDGITEASSDDGTEFGEENIAAVALAYQGTSAVELNERILARASQFCHSRFEDDATLLVVAVR